MPKKHNKYPFIKPASTVHPSLEPSSSKGHHAKSSSTASRSESVNDLIRHLRQTQVSSSDDVTSNFPRHLTPRTLHPSLRDILDLPETPPPRPRLNALPLRSRYFRRTPGPPPPSSWIRADNINTPLAGKEGIVLGGDQVLYRLERLPGIEFPPKSSFQHVLLKSMAINWTWHLAYDNEFLAEIPNRLKLLLLSYIAMYSRESNMGSRTNDLDLLFAVPGTDYANETSYVTRLDLSVSIGKWMSMRLLSKQLLIPSKKGKVPISQKQDDVPTSWDDAEAVSETAAEDSPLSSPRSLLLHSPSHILRFPNLRYLSLAHPDRAAANWGSLVTLLSHISTITHLSLAHWPIPTLTPNSINARAGHPNIRLLTFAAGGIDPYCADENNWVEAVSILRRLSRATYCLKWLDLEGCSEWFGALSWDGRTLQDDEPFQTLATSWNGSWRDIEWIGLGPGWIPSKHIEIDDSFASRTSLAASSWQELDFQRQAASGNLDDDDLRSVLTEEDLREAEIAREKQRRLNEWKAYENALRKARQAQKHIHRVRREGGGKWIHFSFGGGREEENRVLDTVMPNINT